jgi:hypothetical protein
MDRPPAVIWSLFPSADQDAASKGAIELADDETLQSYSENFTFAHHVRLNRRKYESMTKIITPIPNSSRRFLQTPSVSKIPSNCLHPWYYTQCIAIESLQELAEHLQAPNDWRERIDRSKQQDDVAAALNDLRMDEVGRRQEVIIKKPNLLIFHI